MAGYRQGTTVEEVDDRRIAQDQRIGLEIAIIRGRKLVDAWCHNRHGGHQQGIERGDVGLGRGDPVYTRLQQFDEIRRRHLLAAENARNHARVVVVLRPFDPFTVPGPGLCGRKPALGIDLPQTIEARQFQFDDARTRAGQFRQAGAEGIGNLLVHAIEHDIGRYGQAQTGQINGRQRHEILVGKDGVEQGAAVHALRNRPQGIKVGGQRQSPFGRNPAGCRFEAGQPAQRRRNADRAAGIGTNADQRHAVADRHRRPGR